jgi:Uma2 family endonuclease
MSRVKKLEQITVEEYLEAEKWAEVRHEFVGGQIYAMVGASNVDNLIAGSLFAQLRAHLKAPCHVYMSDMKVCVKDEFYYPDLVVSCEAVSGINYYLSEPTVIIEILSPTTEARDRIEKSIAYRNLVELKEYVLVSQEKFHVEVLRRVGETWEVETYFSEDMVHLRSIGFETPISTIYEDVAKLLWARN